MANVEIYTKDWCGYSRRAKADLSQKGVSYTEIDVTNDPVREQEMIGRTKSHTVPQIFIDGVHIGGSDELRIADANGQLDRLLEQSSQGKAA